MYETETYIVRKGSKMFTYGRIVLCNFTISLTNIEDEIHFLFHCPKYSTLRETFFNQIYLQLPNVGILPIQKLSKYWWIPPII